MWGWLLKLGAGWHYEAPDRDGDTDICGVQIVPLSNSVSNIPFLYLSMAFASGIDPKHLKILHL